MSIYTVVMDEQISRPDTVDATRTTCLKFKHFDQALIEFAKLVLKHKTSIEVYEGDTRVINYEPITALVK